MHKINKGFTLVELMVVIFIVGILASVMIPMMRARVDRSKWSEACTSAGAIRESIRNYAAETSISTVKLLVGSNLGDGATQDILGFSPEDLVGTYFIPENYSITSINDDGLASITVEGGSKELSPEGSYILKENGKWEMK